jgi:hypothetical protein
LINSLDIVIALLMGTVIMIILFLFSPAIIELKKPRDNGPRIIFEVEMILKIFWAEKNLIFDVDSLFTSYGTLSETSFLDVMPNLEG